MATVSFRVPDGVRKRMDAAGVDWADRLRAFVEEELARKDVEAALRSARKLRKKYARAARSFSMSAEVMRSRREDH